MKEWDEGGEEGIQYGEGKTLFPQQYLYVGDEWCESEPHPLEMWNYRLCFYLGESEIFRTTFRSIYDMREFRVDIDKNNQTITCS
ncbi:MAG: hypothetical protein N3G21_08605, partial [Candidatus Hydrogenedentes bacterium]|nr:hypothetical protein [Candidatus Hydrogenedentota bacterium]